MEGLYEGGTSVGLVGVGILDPDKKYNDSQNPFIFEFKIPKLLSYLATGDGDDYIPGIKNIIEGGYTTLRGEEAIPMEEKIEKGKVAIQALADFRQAKKDDDQQKMDEAKKTLEDNFSYFGYGYLSHPEQLIPDVGLTFYSFHIMVILGGYFILLFIVAIFLERKKKLLHLRWFQWVGLWSILLAYIASQAGWIVAEVGRQPWAIQDIMPTSAAISKLQTSSVQTTFFMFLILFTILLIAEIGIMVKAIKKGPETADV